MKYKWILIILVVICIAALQTIYINYDTEKNIYIDSKAIYINENTLTKESSILVDGTIIHDRIDNDYFYKRIVEFDNNVYDFNTGFGYRLYKIDDNLFYGDAPRRKYGKSFTFQLYLDIESKRGILIEYEEDTSFHLSNSFYYFPYNSEKIETIIEEKNKFKEKKNAYKRKI